MATEELKLNVVLDGFSQFSLGVNAMNSAIDLLGRAWGALSGPASAAIESAISVESAFAGVAKTTDGLVDDFGNLTEKGDEVRDGFIELSEKIPTDLEELMGIGELGGQLGITEENLISFTETIAAMGVATNLTGEEAASAFAQIANVMGTPQEQISNMGSAVVELGNNFATTESDIVNFAQRIAGAGEIAGLTEAQVFGVAGAFSSVGIQAEAGGTAVQKVLLAMNEAATGASKAIVDNSGAIAGNTEKLQDLQSKLAIAVQRQSEFTDRTKESTKMANQARIDKLTRQIQEQTGALGDLNAAHGQLVDVSGEQLAIFAKVTGKTVDEFKKLWEKDAGEAFQLFVEGIGKSGDEAIGILEDLGLQDQRLIRSFLSLGNAGDLLARSMDASNTAFEENTALAEEAAKRYATTESKIKLFKNQIRNVGIAIGDSFLPMIQKMIDSLSGIIRNVAPSIEIAFGRIATKVSEVIDIFSGLLDGSLGWKDFVHKDMQPTIQTLIDSFSRIGLNVSFLVSLIKQFVFTNLQKFGEWVAKNRPLIINAVSKIVEWWGNLAGTILVFWTKVQPVLGSFVKFVGEVATKILKWFSENSSLIDRVGEKFVDFGLAVIEAIKNIWPIVEPILSALLDIILEIATLIMQVALGDWSDAWDTIKNIVRIAWDGIKRSFGELADFVASWFGTDWETVKKQWSDSWDLIKEAVKLAVGKVKDFFKDMTDFVTETTTDTKNVWKDNWTLFKKIVGEILKKISTDIKDKLSSIKESIEEAWTAIKDKATEIWTEIKNSVEEILQSMFAQMGIDLDEFRAQWREIFEDLGLIATTIISRAKERILNTVKEMVDGIKGKLDELSGFLSDALSAMVKIASEKAQEIFNAITEKITAIGQWIEDNTAPIREFGAKVVSKIVSGIKANATKIINAVANAITAIGDKIEQIKEKLTDFGKSIIDKISEGLVAAGGAIQDAISGAISNALDLALTAESVIKGLATVGFGIVQGVIAGIQTGWGDLLQAITDLISDIVQQWLDDLGLGSPSKVFAQIGRNVIDGFIAGLQSRDATLAITPIIGDMTAAAQSVTQSVQAQIAGFTSPSAMGNTMIDNSVTENNYNLTTQSLATPQSLAFEFEGMSMASR